MSLRRSLAIARNEARVLRRDPSPLVVLLAMPVLVMPILRSSIRATLVLSGHPHATGAELAVPGQAMEFLFFLPPYVGFAFFRDHGWGTWSRLRASATTSGEILAGKALPMVCLGALQLVAVFVVGVVVLHLHVRGSVVGLVLLTAACLACAIAIGIALTAMFRSLQQLSAIGFLGATLFAAIGGAFVPLDALPRWARAIAPGTPHYWAMRGFRALLLDGQGIGAIVAPVAVLGSITVACVLVALARLRFDDVKTGWA